ncbi:hypothetical protein ACFLVW_07975, partial [Chloroflexota bacterium]
PFLDIMHSFLTAAIGCICVAAAFEGFWFWGRVYLGSRVPLFVGGIMLIIPSITFELIGFGLLVAGLLLNLFLTRRQRLMETSLGNGSSAP